MQVIMFCLVSVDLMVTTDNRDFRQSAAVTDHSPITSTPVLRKQ
jgi:hypothetical protein